MVEPNISGLSVGKQCALLSISRSSFYYEPKGKTEITRDNIKSTLGPIWRSKAPTAIKAIQRLDIVLRHASAMGLAVDRMAVDDAKHLLGAQGHNPQKHPTLPATQAPALLQALDVSNVTQRVLAFEPPMFQRG